MSPPRLEPTTRARELIRRQSQATPFHARRQELLDTFEDHFQNLVDVLEFKVGLKRLCLSV
jgi:hypothetical protein